VTAPVDDEPASAPDHDAARAGKPSVAASAVRGFGRQVSLIVTAIVIVVGLAFGIPWLIGLVWR
jgi:hypothetical protein